MSTYNNSGFVATVYENGSIYINSTIYDFPPAGILVPPSPPNATDCPGMSLIDCQVHEVQSNWDFYTVVRCYAIVCTVMTFIGILLVVGRLYVRVRLVKHVFFDDVLILISMLCGIVSYSVYIVEFARTLPDILWYTRHPMWEIAPPRYAPGYPLLSNLEIWFYSFNNFQALFGRLSILYTFSRLAIQIENNMLRKLRIAIHSFSVLMILEGIVVTWIAIDPCWPPTGGKWYLGVEIFKSNCLQWSYSSPWGDYLTRTFIVTAAFNCVADLICFALPYVIFYFWSITLSGFSQWGLQGLFGFGFFVFVISVLRCVETGLWVHQSHREHPGEVRLVWALVEANVVMIGACLPVITKPIWRAFRNRFLDREDTSDEPSRGFPERKIQVDASTGMLAEDPEVGPVRPSR